MSKKCNHTSVGMIVKKGDKILLIERAKLPFGYAIPAGHVEDGEEYEAAAVRELKEEVGLDSTRLDLVIEGRMENPCRREDGNWHFWKIFQISVEGEVARSEDETKRVNWYSHDQIRQLAARTEDYKAGGISEEAWENNPGLEPVMSDWFKKIGLI